MPAVIKILERFDLVACFACIGLWAKRYKDIHRAIVSSGHEVLNHSYSHPDNEELNLKRFSYLTFEEQKKEIEQGHQELLDVLQTDIIRFRTPHFGNQHVYNVYSILKDINYQYSSSILTANVNGTSNLLREKRTGIIEIPVATVPGIPWASFDSWNYFNKRVPLYLRGRSIVEDFKKIVETAMVQGGYVNVYFDPADFATRNEYTDICRLLKELENNCVVVNYKDILKKCEETI